MRNKYYFASILLACLMVFTACSKGESAKELYKSANKFFNQGDYEKACEYYEKAIEINSEKAEYYIDFGMALIKSGKIDDAMIQFDKAILDKDNKIVRENNKLSHRGKGIGYFEISDYKNALKELKKALEIKELSDLNMDILYYINDSYQKLGDFENALKTLEEINDMKKGKDSIVLGKMAYVKQQLGDIEGAIKSYDEALKRDKNNYDLYFGKYNLLVVQGKEEEAAQTLNNALTINAKTIEDKFNVGKINYLQGKHDEAMKLLDEAVENGLSSAYYYIGAIYFEKENYKSAVLNFKNYIDKQESIKSGLVYNQIAEALIKSGEYEEALDYIKEGIKLNDSSVMKKLKYNEIIVYENINDFKSAYNKAKKYVKDYPDDEDMKREYEFLKTRQGQDNGGKNNK